MKGSILKLRLLVFLFICALVISCGDTIDKSGEIPLVVVATDTTIDAKASASKKIKVHGGKIYSDSAVVNFKYDFNNGYTWAKVIDANGKSILCDTINLPPYEYPSETDTSHTLKPLVPATEYRLIIYGIYWEDKNQIWAIDTIRFTTREK